MNRNSTHPRSGTFRPLAFTSNRTVLTWLRYLFLIVISIPFIFPFWWMFTTSLKPISDVFGQLTILPETWLFSNYVEVFQFQPFALHYFNSVYIAVVVTVLTLIVSTLAGYGFARIRFRGNSLFFVMLLTSLMMPIEVTIIPNFYLMQSLGWTDTHLPLIVPSVLGPQGIVATFMMRQFFLSFPDELEDAARIDGLGRFGILWRIALPIARSILGTVAILTFLYSWNSFLEPLIYLSDQNLFTIPLSLRSYTDSYGFPLWNIQLAATVLSVVPMLIVFILAQRQIVDSFARSGLKG